VPGNLHTGLHKLTVEEQVRRLSGLDGMSIRAVNRHAVAPVSSRMAGGCAHRFRSCCSATAGILQLKKTLNNYLNLNY